MPEVVTAPVREGDILAAKYRVDSILGAGGMGVVVAATHLQLDQRVALKFLVSNGIDEQAGARFLREARVVVQLKSEHVVRVLDTGTLDNGLPYIVMDLLEGRDLQQELSARGPVTIVEAVDWVLQAGEGIAEAHALGIVHRDLKPANLFLTHRADHSPLVKVLDFGTSTLLDLQRAPDYAATKTATLMGSPHYLSPEQIRNAKSVDQRADIWALGVVLYELLLGSAPFSAPNEPELLAQIVDDAPKPLRALRPDVPRGLEAVVSRCLEKEPARRFANISDFARELARFGSEDARASSERIARISLARAFPKPADRAVQWGPGPTLSAREPPQQRPPSTGARWVLPLAIAACATLGVLWLTLGGREVGRIAATPVRSGGSANSDRADPPAVGSEVTPLLGPVVAQSVTAPVQQGDGAVAPAAAAAAIPVEATALRRPIQSVVRHMDLTRVPAPIPLRIPAQLVPSALRAPEPAPAATPLDDRK